LRRPVPDPAARGGGLRLRAEKLKRATAAWLKTLAAEGKAPPPPLADQEFSGEFRLRLPKELHRKLAVEAERNRTSLNTYCVCKLAGQR
jgi:predicted HicB family RNase H-like nuclease